MREDGVYDRWVQDCCTSEEELAGSSRPDKALFRVGEQFSSLRSRNQVNHRRIFRLDVLTGKIEGRGSRRGVKSRGFSQCWQQGKGGA